MWAAVRPCRIPSEIGNRFHTGPLWGNLLDPGELLECVAGRVPAAAAAEGGVGDLAYVQVAPRVDAESVRRGEGRRRARVVPAPAGEQPSLEIADTHLRRTRLEKWTPVHVRLVGVPRHLAHEHVAGGVDPQVAGAGHLRPDREHLAGGTEDLDPVVFPIAHEHPPVGVHPHAMRQIELARLRARLAPRLDQLAVPRKAVDAGVAVTVGDVQLA